MRLKDHNNNFLRYVSRYHDGGNEFLNFLNLDFSTLTSEVVWLFPPKSQEGIFLQYYLSAPKRPRLVLLLLQHQNLPSLYNFALDNCTQHITFPDKNYLSQAVKGSGARKAHPFKGFFHLFDFPQKI